MTPILRWLRGLWKRLELNLIKLIKLMKISFIFLNKFKKSKSILCKSWSLYEQSGMFVSPISKEKLGKLSLRAHSLALSAGHFFIKTGNPSFVSIHSWVLNFPFSRTQACVSVGCQATQIFSVAHPIKASLGCEVTHILFVLFCIHKDVKPGFCAQQL